MSVSSVTMRGAKLRQTPKATSRSSTQTRIRLRSSFRWPDRLMLPSGLELSACLFFVFIGGSGGKLREIIDILHSKGGGIRFVINAVSLETIEEAREAVRDLSPSDAEIIMMSVSDIQKAGSYHMLHAQNPVFIFSFTV